MSAHEDNPCLACATGQHCCSRLSGLFLAEAEFQALFQQYEHRLIVRRSNRIVRIYMANGGACPYWGANGCRIYAERPVDCRLFPYIPQHVIEKRKTVEMIYHDRSDCPLKDTLLPLVRESELRLLLVALGKKMYGDGKNIVVRQEKGRLAQFRNRLMAAVSRRVFKAR
ncbi:MAG TPA: YkgJ family cysteine cluster protein [Geomonas sp.]|nr:YkgJ family cysteine cluster protein [Geomonas sp.]